MQNNIKRLRLERGMSQQDLADAVGAKTWQTISNIERGVSGLNEKKVAKYAEALGVQPWEIIGAPREERLITVNGYVQAGHFAETWELDEADQYTVPVPDEPKFRGFELYAAEVRGPSMNRRYPEQSVVIFTHAVETGEDIVPGKRYVIERERADGLREATVKLLWQDEDGKAWLLPESDDPRFQEPIALDGGEDDTIRIVGRVRFAVVRED